MELAAQTLGLLGSGNMAEALLRGLLRTRRMAPERIMASDVAPERRELLARELGVRTSADNRAVAAAADLILLCVKPQQAAGVLAEVAEVFRPGGQSLGSICAGISTARLEEALPPGARVTRLMPNTPLLIGLGATCLCGGKAAREDDLAAWEALFASGGLTLRVEERMLDAVTGLSGSGPAYLFYLAEILTEAGVAEGFSRADALTLAARTCLGAAQMLETTGLPPEELRRRVTSPQGTTQAALEVLEAEGVKARWIAAVRRAAERSRELGGRPG